MEIAGNPYLAALIYLLTPSSAGSVSEDLLVAQENAAWLALDTPDADQVQLATTNSSGVTIANVPLTSYNGSINDALAISINPNAGYGVVALTSGNGSTLTVSSISNSATALGDQVTESLLGGGYDDQIGLSVDANGVLHVNVTIEPDDVAEVAANTTLSNVVQDYTFSTQSGTLKLDAPASFVGTISGFAAGDIIDFVDVVTTGGTIGADGNLTVETTGAAALTLNFSDVTSPEPVYAIPDGNGGTDLVLTEPVPATTVPGTETVAEGVWTAIAGVSVSVPGSPAANEVITVVLSDSTGVLAASTPSFPAFGSGTSNLTLTGSVAAINAELSTLTYMGNVPNSSDVIDVKTTNDQGAGDDHQINIQVNGPTNPPVVGRQ